MYKTHTSCLLGWRVDSPPAERPVCPFPPHLGRLLLIRATRTRIGMLTVSRDVATLGLPTRLVTTTLFRVGYFELVGALDRGYTYTQLIATLPLPVELPFTLGLL